MQQEAALTKRGIQLEALKQNSNKNTRWISRSSSFCRWYANARDMLSAARDDLRESTGLV